MPKIEVKGHTVQTGECPQSNGLTHICYQKYYRPCYAVDKYKTDSALVYICTSGLRLGLGFRVRVSIVRASMVRVTASTSCSFDLEYSLLGYTATGIMLSPSEYEII